MAGRDLYIIQMAVTGELKVGRSDDVQTRLKQLQTACPHTLKLLLHVPNHGCWEKDLHKTLSRYRTRVCKGEWFSEEGLGWLPLYLYNKIPEQILEETDWWKTAR